MIIIIAVVAFFLIYSKGLADTKVEVTIITPPTILESISFFAKEYNVDEIQMVRLANCESKLKPRAWNKSDPEGGSKGLFQFLPSTWRRYTKELGLTLDIWSAYDQSRVTAYMISKNQIGQWSCAKLI